MFKKDRIYHAGQQRLTEKTEELKHEFESFQLIIEKSLDPSAETIAYLKIKKAKYMFLLKEMRYQQTLQKNK
ncbi:DUF2508 family protein [Sinobaca sp. H24]|uniref:DUF2508 family protein n=1 Tax=Sinobaca sp. H24 TaxID=2923376 RepID=UPI002079265A|nr:DUF2508 family protein [Sinobaca sp. H24]